MRFSTIVFIGVGVVIYLFVWLFSVCFFRIFTPGADAVAVFAAEKSRAYFSGFVFAGLNILVITYLLSTA